MQAFYSDNKAFGPGNGTITLRGDNLPQPPWSIALQRSTDQKYASGDGQCVGEICSLPAAAQIGANGDLNIPIGPGIVDSLDQLEQYRVILKGAGGKTANARLALGSISRSPDARLDNTARPRQELPKPAKPEPVPERAEAIILPEPAKQDAPTGKKKLLRYTIVCVLALLCVLWAIFDRNRKSEDAAPQKTGIEQPAGSDAAAQVRAFFTSQNHTAKGAADLALKLPKDDIPSQDAAYRLYYYAAENGEPSIYLDYAACLDPSRAQWGTIQKDALQAGEIYRKAMGANMAGAAEALENMRAWLKNAAEQGDQKASAWLKQMKE